MEYIVPSITFLIGLAAAFVFQFYQSKEVLKQTLYKEKIHLYKTILNKANTFTMHLYTYFNRDKEIISEALKELIDFQKIILENAFLLPDELIPHLNEFARIAKESIVKENFSLFTSNDPYTKIYSEIRTDLGIKKLSSELVGLYQGYIPLTLLKLKNKD